MPLGAAETVLGPRAETAIRTLERGRTGEAVSTLRRVRALRPILLADCLHDEVVPKDRVPRALRDAHGLENLYVEDLPSFWRLLYTVVREGATRYVVVFEIVDHDTYSKWFPGRGR